MLLFFESFAPSCPRFLVSVLQPGRKYTRWISYLSQQLSSVEQCLVHVFVQGEELAMPARFGGGRSLRHRRAYFPSTISWHLWSASRIIYFKMFMGLCSNVYASGTSLELVEALVILSLAFYATRDSFGHMVAPLGFHVSSKLSDISIAAERRLFQANDVIIQANCPADQLSYS